MFNIKTPETVFLSEKLAATELALSKCIKVLILVGTPKRPGGTFNVDREACFQLAKNVLLEIDNFDI